MREMKLLLGLMSLKFLSLSLSMLVVFQSNRGAMRTFGDVLFVRIRVRVSFVR